MVHYTEKTKEIKAKEDVELEQVGWKHPSVPALWVVINTSSPGTIDDPFPAVRGMKYTYGLYYLDPDDGKTYLCKRGSETGTIVLQYLPHELIGHYFKAV